MFVALKKEDDVLARARLEELKAGRHGRRPTPEELRARVVNGYLSVLDGVGILTLSQGERLAKMIERISPGVAAASSGK